MKKENGVKVFFLSNRNSCRSQMAEAILRNFDQDLLIYSAGIDPVDHISPVAIEVMEEIGIKIQTKAPEHFSKYKDIEFDYLITVGDGTVEQLKLPPIKFKRKMHLGFRDPYKTFKNREELVEKCREIREEIQTEMDYFYRRIINK